MVRNVKRELGSTSESSRRADGKGESGTTSALPQGITERRAIRSQYLAVKYLISDGREEISRFDSDKFKSIINEVESLHHLVQKPREQVADAEALLDITNSLVTSVKAHGNDGITPSDFVSCLLRNFGQHCGPIVGCTEDDRNSVVWKDIGVTVSHIFRMGPRCFTMIGPMNTELKQRKAVVCRKHARPTESVRPEELTVTDERTDTDKNMSKMFEILRKYREVQLENLVLNRNSFAQTVENLFALSFLVKDGRAEIKVNEQGCHLVSPRNAPAADAIASREVAYSHFVFRFDFKDWKLMTSMVGVGEELMPHRNQENSSSDSQPDSVSGEAPGTAPTTPIRKLSRNRGLVLQEQSVVEDSPSPSPSPSPESDATEASAAAIRKGKRKLR